MLRQVGCTEDTISVTCGLFQTSFMRQQVEMGGGGGKDYSACRLRFAKTYISKDHKASSTFSIQRYRSMFF